MPIQTYPAKGMCARNYGGFVKVKGFIIPKSLFFTETHEWLKVNGEIATLGVTDYMHKLPVNIQIFAKIGREVGKGEAIAVIESTKAVREIFTPVSGKILAVNNKVETEPNIVLTDPYEKGWLVKIRISNFSELNCLLSFEDYVELLIRS